MELDDHHRRTIRGVFSAFDDRDITYVVLRGYRELPEAVPGSDVDLFVDAATFDAAVEECGRLLEPIDSPIEGVLELVTLGMRNPRSAVGFVVDSPREAIAYVAKSLTTTEFSDRKYVERTFGDGDLVVHLVNHLAYTSTLDGSPIRVDRPVEAAMLGRRERVDGFYVPAAPDELAHLVCRGVYDYEGAFPARYESRCDELQESVLGDERRDEQFRELLSLCFYAADELVYDLVAAGEYDSIRDELERFSDY